MTTSNASANLFGISAIPQVDYQTTLAGATAPKNYRQVEKTDRSFGNYQAPSSNNKGYSTGTPYATRKRVESHDFDISFSEDASSQLLPERAKAGLGVLETVETLAGQVYTHTAKLLNPQDASQQPAYGFIQKAGESASRPNARNEKFDSIVCGNFGIRGEGKSILKINTQWKGSGKRTSPSGINFFGVGSHVKLIEESVQNFFLNTTADLKLYPDPNMAGAVFNVQCSFRDVDLSVNQDHQADAGYLGCGLFQTAGDGESGAIRGKCEIGDNQAVTLAFTVLEDDAYDAYTKMQTMKSISAELSYVGKVITGIHKHKFTIRVVAANIMSIDHTIVDGKNALRITLEPLAQGQIMPVELVTVNNVASYTVPSW